MLRRGQRWYRVPPGRLGNEKAARDIGNDPAGVLIGRLQLLLLRVPRVVPVSHSREMMRHSRRVQERVLSRRRSLRRGMLLLLLQMIWHRRGS